MNSAKVAERCFDENRNLFGNAHTEPEKFNLYQGLANLAAAVGELEGQIQQLRYEVQVIRQDLGRIGR